MNDPALTPVLENLITRSALPLRGLESHFAIDSTAFSTSVYARWFDQKYARVKKAEKWVKAHAMAGANTHIVTAVAVTGQDVNDSPMLKPLLDATAENFDVQQVSADKAYLGRANLWEIHERGAAAFIPFKSNSILRGGDTPLDALWNRAYHYFQLHRESFLEQYHLRSNVETVFHMVKSKFSHKVRSKHPVSQVNEVLAKFLCHNICVLIQAAYEFELDLLGNQTFGAESHHALKGWSN